MKVFFLYGILCDLLLVIHCTLISRSILEHCAGGDTSEPLSADGQPCSKKFVIAMTLESGQEGTEAIYGNINTAYDVEKRKKGILKKPFRIEIDKSEVIVNYRVYYRGSANALPKEHVIVSSTMSCIDDWYSEYTSCGKYVDKEGEAIWDSQGFCCKCEFSKNNVTRGNVSCEQVLKTGRIIIGEDEKVYIYGSSAHCMNLSDLWYDIFEVESPNLHYNISVQLKILEVTKQNDELVQRWRSISNFTLNPAKTGGRSPSGRVVADIEGDLLGHRGLMDLTTKRLLIPSLRVWHKDSIPPEYQNGPDDWLLVDEHLVDLSGRECNKVGVSFSGFRNQNAKCYQLPESCFSNQPSLFWKADNERRSHGIKGFYMMHNYGEIHRSTHVNNSSFIMRMVYPDLHNTFITFRLDATDVSFVINVGKGRIVKAEARGFNKSTSTTGEVVVVVQNQGDLTQDFIIALTKCFGREDLPSRKVKTQPGRSEVVIFPLLAHNRRKKSVHCEVQLFDLTFALLGSAKLTFNVEAPCFCFGICGCSCDEITGEVTNNVCPTPPPIYVDTTGIGLKILFHILEFIGLHGIVGFFCGTLLCCGCVRLTFGGIIFCRKSKAQEYYDEMRKKGAQRARGPVLVKCSGECRGALAAKARVKRKVEYLRRRGMSPHRLDDWANTSFSCSCNDELSDIRFVSVIKALCFFYYLLILPFIMLGKTIYWRLFAETKDKKKAAEKAVLKMASKKGPEELEKLGIVSLEKELIKKAKEMGEYEAEIDKGKELDKEKEKAQMRKNRLEKKKELRMTVGDEQIAAKYSSQPLLVLSKPVPREPTQAPPASAQSQSHLAPPVQKKRKMTLNKNIPRSPKGGQKQAPESKRTAPRHLQDHGDQRNGNGAPHFVENKMSKNDKSTVLQDSPRRSTGEPPSLQNTRTDASAQHVSLAKPRQSQQSVSQPKSRSLQGKKQIAPPQQSPHTQPKSHGSHTQPKSHGSHTQPKSHGSHTQPKSHDSHTQPKSHGSHTQPKQSKQPPRQKYPSTQQTMESTQIVECSDVLEDNSLDDKDEDMKSDDDMAEDNRRNHDRNYDSRTSQFGQREDHNEDEDFEDAVEEHYLGRGTHDSHAPGQIESHYEYGDEELSMDGMEEYYDRRDGQDREGDNHTSQAGQRAGPHASTQRRNSHISTDSGDRDEQAVDERLPGVVYRESLETLDYNHDEPYL